MRHASPGAPVLFMVALLAGCATPLEERFYALSPSTAAQPATRTARYQVAVGPVTVPALDDRPQIVLRAGPNRVTLSEQSRWAEPLQDGIERVVADDLASLLDDAQVLASSQRAAGGARCRVLLDVQRMDSLSGEAAVLDMSWTVMASDAGVVHAGRSVIREPVAGPGYDALVAAHSRALAAASRDIAAALRELRACGNPLPR